MLSCILCSRCLNSLSKLQKVPRRANTPAAITYLTNRPERKHINLLISQLLLYKLTLSWVMSTRFAKSDSLWSALRWFISVITQRRTQVQIYRPNQTPISNRTNPTQSMDETDSCTVIAYVKHNQGHQIANRIGQKTAKRLTLQIITFIR